MKAPCPGRAGAGLLCLVAALSSLRIAHAQTGSYPSMAPIAQYRMDRGAEIDMARSAAPESISGDARILVLGTHGYEEAAAGRNGFVCLVQRSWAAGIESPEFWNPKLRAPICLNAEAARSFLPHVTKKTEWALAGLSKEQMIERIDAALRTKAFPAFEPGAMCYMMSKQGYLSDSGGRWHPHVMFFTAAIEAATWGANLSDSPMLATIDRTENFTIFILTVDHWSDGTAANPPE